MQPPSTGPRIAYLDTCVVSAMVKGELSSADSQALGQMGALVQSSALTLWTSTVMKEELLKIPEAYRQKHIDAYNSLRIVAAHPTTGWIDDDPGSPTFNQPTKHPIYARLEQAVPDRDDARHLFQAYVNKIDDFITLDQRTILNRRSEVKSVVPVDPWSPEQFMSNWST